MPVLGHEFTDPSLLERALTHASAGEPHNERLEFLGDAVLDLVVAEELFHGLPAAPEGELTDRKARVVSRASLAGAARSMGLLEHARLGQGLSGQEVSAAVLANLYEAVLGAVYLDGGFAAARAFALRTLEGPLERARAVLDARSPKQVLQELCQRDHGAPPVYELLETRGEAHARAFQVRALLAGEAFPPAWGRTRKEAEGWAAREALQVLAEREGGTPAP